MIRICCVGDLKIVGTGGGRRGMQWIWWYGGKCIGMLEVNKDILNELVVMIEVLSMCIDVAYGGYYSNC